MYSSEVGKRMLNKHRKAVVLEADYVSPYRRGKDGVERLSFCFLYCSRCVLLLASLSMRMVTIRVDKYAGMRLMLSFLLRY